MIIAKTKNRSMFNALIGAVLFGIFALIYYIFARYVPEKKGIKQSEEKIKENTKSKKITKKRSSKSKKNKSDWPLIISIVVFSFAFIAILIVMMSYALAIIPILIFAILLAPIFDDYLIKLFGSKNKKSLWLLKSGIIFISIIIWIIIGALNPSCPKTCNDNNACTTDVCNANTSYVCVNENIPNCNGNGICETNEIGSPDCPNRQCLVDDCYLNKEYIFCNITNSTYAAKVNKGKVVGKCNVSCVSNADCSGFNKCVDSTCCMDECIVDSCVGYNYIKCENTTNSCNIKLDKGIVIGQCGVECKSDVDCSYGYSCNEKHECTTYKLNESIQEGNFKWIFTDYYTAQTLGGAYWSSTADGIYLAVYADVTNVGKSPEYMSSSLISLVDNQGRIFEPESYLLGYGEFMLVFDKMNPGLSKSGYIVFDVPKDLKIAYIKVSDGSLVNNYKLVRVSLKS